MSINYSRSPTAIDVDLVFFDEYEKFIEIENAGIKDKPSNDRRPEYRKLETRGKKWRNPK